jgi:NitT/TauT family transport system permease protein
MSDFKLSEIAKRYVAPFVFFCLLLAVWELICRFFSVPDYVVPAPSHIGQQIFKNFQRLLLHSSITAGGALAGFLVANLMSFVVALIFTKSPLVERSSYPYLVALKSVPIVALAPLITLWLGDGFASKVAMAALITFFPMVVNATLGLKSSDPRSIALLKVMGASQAQTFKKLRIPTAIPYIISALKISAPLAVVGAIVAEIAGAASGIGYLILVAAYKVDTSFMFACVVFAALVGLLFFGFASLIEFWWDKPRRQPNDFVSTLLNKLRNGEAPTMEMAKLLEKNIITDAVRPSLLKSDEAHLAAWLKSKNEAAVIAAGHLLPKAKSA